MDMSTGICLIFVFAKWYITSLVMMMAEYPPPSSWSHIIREGRGLSGDGRD